MGHLAMFGGFRHAMSPDRILPFVVGGLTGVPIGVWLLTVIPADASRLFGGLLLSVYSLVSLARGLRFQVAHRAPVSDSAIGFCGGICGGLASLSGPIVTVWCGLKGWTPDEQRAAYQPYNFAVLSAALVGFGSAGLFTLELASIAALTLPATLVGVWSGRVRYGHVNATIFRRIVLILLSMSGLALVARNLL